MEWTGEAIILGARKHGEADVILEVMTAERGRHLGLVRGGRSRRRQPTLQPGNEVQVTWRARLSEHLGSFTVDPIRSRAAELMTSSVGLHGVQHLASLLRLLPERDPHARLYEAFKVVLDHLDRFDVAGPLIIRFELELLNELVVSVSISPHVLRPAHAKTWPGSRRNRLGQSAGRPANPIATSCFPCPRFWSKASASRAARSPTRI